MSTNACYHCGQAVSENFDVQVEIEGKARNMCCTGCEAVAKAIVENNLTDFYNYRTESPQDTDSLIPKELQELEAYDNEALQESFVRQEGDGTIREASLILEGIVCAACIWLNEQHVTRLQGVLDFKVNYSTHRASLKWDNSQVQLSQILKAISDIGYHAHPFDANRLESLQQKEKSKALKRIAISGIGMMQVMVIAIALYIGESNGMTDSMKSFLEWVSLIITIPVILFASRIFFTAAWRDLKRRQFGMDVPVSIAMGAAFLASAWATVTQTGEIYFDSVTMFTFFLLTGRYLEMMARHKAGRVADALIRLMPATATRIHQNKHETIAVNELEIGDTVLIKPGETIPADGKIIDGESSVNESLLTGESLPLYRQINDQLIGGTVNIESPLQMRVEKLGDSTVLFDIIRLLDRAQREKPKLAQLADRLAGWFVLTLLIIATVVFFAWYWASPEDAFWITLSVLVVTCPCALSLATPAALTAATGVLTERGVLTTRGHALETLAKVQHIIFDKTGTLTKGRLHVGEIHQFDQSLTQQEIVDLAAGLEQYSEHPIAQAITALSNQNKQFSDITAISGQGIEGIYQGKTYRLGNQQYAAEITGDFQSKQQKTAGMTSVYLGTEHQLIAQFDLQDEIREEASHVIQQLKKLGIQTSLLSGDQPETVDAVKNHLAIEQGQGSLLPQDKLQAVQQLQDQNTVVAMVGDGVNDAPVLAGANVSLAMGNGSQLAQASADMILLSDQLDQLPKAIKTARNMQTIIKQNFAWAIGYNLVAIPLAAMGWIQPWMAAIGMSLSSLLVVLNALRIRE